MRFGFSFSIVLSAVPLLYGQTPVAPAPSAAQQTLSLRVAGSSIVDVNGEMSGNVESVVIDPQTGQIRFAMVSTEYPANRLNVTPIPWQMLRYRSSGGIPGTYQQLSLPVARNVVAAAPRITAEQSAAADGSTWMNTSAAFFQTAAGANTAAGSTAAPAGGGGGAFSPFATVPGAYQTQPTNGLGFTTNAAGGRGLTNFAGNNQFTATNAFGTARPQTNFSGTAAGVPANGGLINPVNVQGAVPVNPPTDVGAPPNDSGFTTPNTQPRDVVPPNKQPLAPAAPARPAAPATPGR